jgi:hypothetical protein
MAVDIEVQQSDQERKLTSWEKEPTLKELQGDFESARQNHDSQTTLITEWLDYLFLRGKAKMKEDPNRSAVQPALIRKQAEWRYANLSEPFLSSPDMFNVKPVTWEDRNAARHNSMVLNHQFNNRIDKQAFIDTMVRAAVDEGTAIVKIGWMYRVKKVKEMQPVYHILPDPSEAAQQELLRIDDLYNNSPSQYNELPIEWQAAYRQTVETGIPNSPVVRDWEEVEVEKTVENRPILEVCDYRNVIIDPSCGGDLDKAGFVIHRFEASMSDLKADRRYKNLDLISPMNQTILGENDAAIKADTQQTFEFMDKARRKFIVYEYWGFRDIDGSGVVKPFVAAWVGNVKIRMEENPFPDQKVPFVTMAYLPVRGSVYGESDGSLLIDNQKVVGAVTRGMIDVMARSANGQVGIAKGALDAVEMRKFNNGENYQFNPGNDPRMAIYMHKFDELPASAQFMVESQNIEAESITGVKAFSAGIAGQALGDTATGIRGALDAASKRELGLLRRLSSGMCKIGRKIIAMNQEFLDEKEVVRITNEQFIEVRKDDLAGQFDLDLTISTAEEDNAKAQELAFILQTVGPNSDPEMTKMIMADIARLRKMPDIAHKIEMYQPQPDPYQQKIQELEILKLQAEIATEQARAASFGAQANLNTQKINTEGAKANHLQAAADRETLDFVQEETGTNHERAMDGLRTQAQSQLGLKIAESQLRQQEAGQMAKASS